MVAEKLTEHEGVVIASVQIDSKLFDSERNLRKILSMISEAQRRNVDLAVFPECALTGYLYDDVEQVKCVAETITGSSMGTILDKCRSTGLHVVVGLIEEQEGVYYNTAAFVGPNGLVGRYRKSHLPRIGVDRLLSPGNDGLESVYETKLGNIGILICYDMSFPESARVLMLRGADIIVLPTIWIPTATYNPDYIIPTRAIENMVYVASCNRVGVEKDVKFFGRSQIISPWGHILAEASDKEEIITADIDVQLAREKGKNIPGMIEVNYLNDRRPELYGAICQG